ncbi:MAG: sensor histidine kinase [Nocardioides sp.]
MSAEPTLDPAAEVELLRRQLAREKARRVAAENIGEQATAELYATVEELRAAQAELVDSMDRLQEVDRHKDAFVSNVSHELRTPLTSIAGYLELVVDGAFGAVPDALHQAVSVAIRNTDRLRLLVEDLLTLSAYDARTVVPDLSELDLGDVVAECYKSAYPSLTGRRLDVDVQVVSDLRRINADRSQVERVVTNLLTNAVKFTPDGGRILVGVQNHRDGVELVVADTGIGVPEDEQHRLFSRFFRSARAAAAEIQGTGLGLALTRTIVELHGGTVRLESVEDEGTTVTVYLPVEPPTAGA